MAKTMPGIMQLAGPALGESQTEPVKISEKDREIGLEESGEQPGLSERNQKK